MYLITRGDIVMKEIIKIVIKGASGCGSYDLAYEDKIVINEDSISYEYIILW